MYLRLLSCALLLASMGVSTPARAGGPPELAPAELAQAQTRQYSVTPKIAFNSVLSALQTLGYVDVNADRDSGTVSAVTDAKAKTIYNIFWGFGKKKWTQKASLLIEENGLGSRVRLNMMLSETKSRGIFGNSFTDGKIVRIAQPYQDFFSTLDQEVRNRGGSPNTVAPQAMNGTSPVELGSGVKLVPAETASGYCVQAPEGYVGTGSATRPAVSEGRPLCS